MAKKYSSGVKKPLSLRELSKNTGTPYGVQSYKANKNNTFTVPEITTKKPFGRVIGKSIHDYVVNPQASQMPGATCDPKFITIKSGEYTAGSFNIGTNSASAFHGSNGQPPVCVEVNRFVSDASGAQDTSYVTVDSITDVGGYYINNTGGNTPTATGSFTNSPNYLSDSDVFPASSKHIIVYHGDDLPAHAFERNITVNFSDGTSQTFDVTIPGIKNTVGWGDTLASIIGPGNYTDQQGFSTNWNCSSNPNTSMDNQARSSTFGHTGTYLGNAATPQLTGFGAAGSGNYGIYSLNVTRLGKFHDNPGLWTEGFQPTDGSGLTGAHQDTFPQGLFHFNKTSTNESTILNWYLAEQGPIDNNLGRMWDLQYNGSLLTPSGNHPSPQRGNPLGADSTQHYEWIATYQLNDVVQGGGAPNYNNISYTSYESNYAGNPGAYAGNTADDAGFYYGHVREELMFESAGLNLMYYTGVSYVNPTGGASGGWLDAPNGVEHSPTFMHIQIYAEDLDCNCPSSPPPGGPTRIDLCTDPNSQEYWQYTGLDCTGAAVPADLMSGTANLGNYGCVTCDYELPPASTSACTNCDCDVNGNPIPQINVTNINAPTTLGGTDASASIEINPAFSGSEEWTYLIEPLANTTAGLGTGAVNAIAGVPQVTVQNGNITASVTTNPSSCSGCGGFIENTHGGNNPNSEFLYHDHDGSVTGIGGYSGSGKGFKIRAGTGANTGSVHSAPVNHLDAIINSGEGYAAGETLVMYGDLHWMVDNAGNNVQFRPACQVTIQNVRGVVVAIHGDQTGSASYKKTPHPATTPSGGLQATIGEGISLLHLAGTSNNYGATEWDFINGRPSVYFNRPGLPFQGADLFFNSDIYPLGETSLVNSRAITGLEAGSYKVTVIENTGVDANTGELKYGCFQQTTLVIPPGINSTNGCTDNNTGTNDGAALNYDAAATVDDNSCIYCRAADGKLVDYQSVELPVVGSASSGDIFTTTLISNILPTTTSVSTDGEIEIGRTLNSIVNYYASLVVDAGGNPNANFVMELYKLPGSAQTLTGGTLTHTQTNVSVSGFNHIFNTANSQGLSYGYYAIKSYVDDPDSASEIEQCFQVDYFIVPVLACLTGPPGLQVGITTDGVTITDPNLIATVIPGNNLNPCAGQCCDVPTLTSYLVPSNSTPGCNTPAFNVEQTCPNGIEAYITNITHDVEFFDGVTWNVVTSQSLTPPATSPFQYNYNIGIYNSFGPGDYRVTTVLEITHPNGLIDTCVETTNSVSLSVDTCGCTDPTALNYDPLAVIDDGSCQYCVYGCMDPNSINYNPLATCDDGSCIACVYGCQDPAATNYNAMATCPGPCNYGAGCGCTNILATNYGKDCNGNIVGYPPPCDDGCCLFGGGNCGGMAPLISNLATTDNTCTCPNNAGCNSNIVATGGPGFYTFDVDFGADKGVAIFTFNTGHSNNITAPLRESVPDAMKLTFDGTTTSEYSALVGGYMRGLVGSPGVACAVSNPALTMPIHANETCANGYVVADMPDIGNGNGVLDLYEFDNQTQTFIQTFNTQQMTDYGATSTGDITVSMWPQAGDTIPNVGDTPNHKTTFSESSHFNRNGVSYVSVPVTTTANNLQITVEAPCDSTWWGLKMSCPSLLTGFSASSTKAPAGSSNSTVDALNVDTRYFHIPIDAAGATNPNSYYWDGTGTGTGQQAGTLGKHDWIFEDAYGVTRLPAGCYKMESPAASGQFWNVTVGVPSYTDDVNADTPPSGPTVDGVVLKMEGPL
tara:strand:+ start:1325 stop:6595 length:5271 start_codon:yes stop_codon:yes gene_type:complete